MGIMLSACEALLEQSCLEEKSLPVDSAMYGLHFRLRVDASPVRPSMGTFMHNFKLTDEFLVEAIEAVPGLEPLAWRYERGARGPLWPSGPRAPVPMRYARARIMNEWVLMAVAAVPEQRSMERVLLDIEDSKDACAYAHSFNAHLMRQSMGADDRTAGDMEAGKVQVCVPIGCRVLSSAIPAFAHPGAVVMLFPLPSAEVQKFLFDCREDFIELAQAFFHYVVWMSGGREALFDLQGFIDDDGAIVLIDPVVIRTPKAGVSSLLTGQGGVATDGPSPETFDAMHPRCSPLCRSFDPQRRGAKARKMCGLDVPACGLAK